MAATKYLDYDGLLYFWTLIKAKLALKPDQDENVKQTVASDNKEYPILTRATDATTTSVGEAKFAAAVTINPSTGTISATTFDGTVDGNADTATEFASAQSVTLTGDVTGTASSTAGWSVATTLANSGVTAGTYKSVTVDAKGRVTAGTNPTTLSGFGITDAYTKTEIDTKLTSAMHYKGSVANVASLPASNNAVGDFYNVTATGENYAWTGSEWDVTGSIIDLQSITNAEIDTVVAS